MKTLSTNQKVVVSILVMLALLCGLQGVSSAADPPAVELQAETEQALSVGNSNTFVVTLLLEGAAWAEISKIREAVAVSGIDGVEIKSESYKTGTTEVWVCTGNCGGFIELGYWSTRGVYDWRPAIQRKSDTVLEVPLTFDGDNFDFDTDATLTFTVEASAIVDYNGASLTAVMMPLITAVSAPSALTEQNLGVNVVRFTITGGRYAAQLLDGAVTVAGIAGVGVSDVVRKSDTVLEVSLTFDGTDFDTQATLAFTVSPDAIANYSVPVTAMIPVTAVIESVSASVVSPLTEATLDSSTVELKITNAVYEQDISKIKEAVTVSGINGVTIDTTTLQRINNRKVTFELKFDGTDLTSDTSLLFNVAGGAITNHNGTLTAKILVTANRNEAVLKVYWTNTFRDKIQRANLDGSNVQDLVTGLDYPSGIALDVSAGKMYWVDSGTDKIQRANLDGSNIEDLVTGLGYPLDIALDVSAGKMYWVDSGKIQRANLDGSNVEDLVTGLDYPSDIALDVSTGKMYWIADAQESIIGGEWVPRGTAKIQCANLDGSNIEDLVTGLGYPSDIALDVSAGKMYWTDKLRDKIQCANLDGSNIEDLVTGLGYPLGIALDVAGGKMYWADYRSVQTDAGKIQRANLDGSNIEDLVTQTRHGPSGIAVSIISPVNQTPTEPVTTNATVSITPAAVVSPFIGEQITFNLNIAGGEAVGGYQATVQFDTTALRYVSSANGGFLPAGAFFGQPVVEGKLVKLNAASLAGEINGDGALATLTFEVIAVKASTLTLSDVLLSNSAGEGFVPQVENAEITEPARLKGDVNGDGIVNILDLVFTASNLGETGENDADVNDDGLVNIQDLVLVAGAIGTGNAAPALNVRALSILTASDVKGWLTQARQLTLTDATSLRGIQFLEHYLATLTPKQTKLLANFPNPFNPETWIPYHLSNDADVEITIYDAQGVVVRQLALGHQRAGFYTDRTKAAYWDGRNNVGEQVASGVYFYTFTAGDFTATRKVLIRK